MIRPVGFQVLIQELPKSPYSDGGIAYPDTYEDPVTRAFVYRVLALGPRCDRAIAPGDRVVLDQFRLNAKSPAGPGLWLVQETSICIIIPNAGEPTGQNQPTASR